VVLKMGGFLKTRNIYLSSHSLWHLGIGADCVYKAGHPIYLKEIYRKTGCNFILSCLDDCYEGKLQNKFDTVECHISTPAQNPRPHQ
jgi:hypothetical protein